MPSLALVMIARDEEAGIARCLESAAHLVDEIIVVDTGSTDATAEVAAQCGASLHHLAWPDDFAAARNHSLSLSRCDWNLVLDADERIIGGADELRESLTEPFLGLVCRKNLMNIGGSDVESFTWIPRILPKGTRYEGRIHEQPMCPFPSRRTALRLDHTGFLPDALARKKGRNQTLLQAALAENPGDVYLLFQLGNEYQVAQDFARSAECYKSALEKSAGNESFRHALIVRAIYSFKMADRLDDAIALADAEIDNWPQSPDFYFTVGDLYLELASRRPELAFGQLLPVVEFSWKKCLEIGERDELDGSVRGRGGPMAAHNLAVFYSTLGDQKTAAKYTALEHELRNFAA